MVDAVYCWSLLAYCTSIIWLQWLCLAAGEDTALQPLIPELFQAIDEGKRGHKVRLVCRSLQGPCACVALLHLLLHANV